MYAYIEGIIDEKTPTSLVIDAGGVGYEILCSSSTIAHAPMRGEKMRVYTYLSVREDAMELLGFSGPDEKKMFLRLTGVSGIGPKTALGILGALPLGELTMALMTGDIAMLSRAPGIGKKTAQRLALELKDKVSAEDFLPAGADGAVLPQSDLPGDMMSEAILALESLGYTRQEAARAVQAAARALPDAAKADDLVKAALRGMMKG